MGESSTVVDFDLAEAGAGRPRDSRRDTGATVLCRVAMLGGCGLPVHLLVRSVHDSSDGSSGLLSRIESNASVTGDEMT